LAGGRGNSGWVADWKSRSLLWNFPGVPKAGLGAAPGKASFVPPFFRAENPLIPPKGLGAGPGGAGGTPPTRGALGFLARLPGFFGRGKIFEGGGRGPHWGFSQSKKNPIRFGGDAKKKQPQKPGAPFFPPGPFQTPLGGKKRGPWGPKFFFPKKTKGGGPGGVLLNPPAGGPPGPKGWAGPWVRLGGDG